MHTWKLAPAVAEILSDTDGTVPEYVKPVFPTVEAAMSFTTHRASYMLHAMKQLLTDKFIDRTMASEIAVVEELSQSIGNPVAAVDMNKIIDTKQDDRAWTHFWKDLLLVAQDKNAAAQMLQHELKAIAANREKERSEYAKSACRDVLEGKTHCGEPSKGDGATSVEGLVHVEESIRGIAQTWEELLPRKEDDPRVPVPSSDRCSSQDVFGGACHGGDQCHGGQEIIESQESISGHIIGPASVRRKRMQASLVCQESSAWHAAELFWASESHSLDGLLAHHNDRWQWHLHADPYTAWACGQLLQPSLAGQGCGNALRDRPPNGERHHACSHRAYGAHNSVCRAGDGDTEDTETRHFPPLPCARRRRSWQIKCRTDKNVALQRGTCSRRSSQVVQEEA